MQSPQPAQNERRVAARRDASKPPGAKTTKRATKADKEATLKKYDVSEIPLDGESEAKVPVYDTCDIIRRRIKAHLRRPEITQAMFLRGLERMFPEGRKTGINARGLGLFTSKKGANAGNTSGVFYAAYVFFEKLRLKERKPKTPFRERMEEVWGNAGMQREVSSAQHYFCSDDERPFVDEYGRVTIDRVR